MDNKKTVASFAEREEKRKKIEKEAFLLQRSALAKIQSLLDPEQFKKMLFLFSRFHRYSFLNIILIFLQFSKASYIAGFKTWENASQNIWNDAARPILKPEYGGKGIRLLAPYTHVQNQQNRTLINFVVSVYDVSQTNNIPPLEEVKECLENPKSHQLISALRSYSPYRIVLAGKENSIIENGFLGYCDHARQIITLDETLKNAKLLEEMIKQVVAVETELSKYSNNHLQSFIEASVLYVLNLRFGFSSEDKLGGSLFSGRYQECSKEDLAGALNMIQRISHNLIEFVEDFLLDLDTYDSCAWIDEESLLNFDIEA